MRAARIYPVFVRVTAHDCEVPGSAGGGFRADVDSLLAGEIGLRGADRDRLKEGC
jgi:hypothetical protein